MNTEATPGKSRVVVLLGAAFALAAMMLVAAPATTHAAGKDKKSAARAVAKAPTKTSTKTSAKAPTTAARAKSPAKNKPVAERSVPAPPAPATTTTSSRDDATTGDAEGAAPTAAGGKTLRTKTYTFGAMDVEGKLKTPQLLYFLNRVKLELDMSAPDKRSFMKELADSADDKNL
jgi:predicted small secreted protein